jgi:hypothetical protein
MIECSSQEEAQPHLEIRALATAVLASWSVGGCVGACGGLQGTTHPHHHQNMELAFYFRGGIPGSDGS